MTRNKSRPGASSQDVKKDPLTRERKLLLYFCSTAHAYTHIVILAIIPLLPLIQSADGGFDLSWRESFLFAAISLFFFGLGAIPTGYAADRIGPLKVIFIGLIVIIASIVIIVTAPNVLTFGIGLLLLGLGSSFYHPAGLSLVSQVYTTERGLPMGIHGFVGNLGELSTPIISGLVGAMFGWRTAYILWLFVGIAILIVNLILLSEGIQNHFISESTLNKKKHSTRELFFKSISMIIILAILYALLFELSYRGTIQLIPFAAQSIQGLTASEAASIGGIIVTVLILVGAFAQLVGGKLADRYGNQMPLFFFSATAIIALIIMKSNLFAYTITFNDHTFVVDSLLLGAAIFGFGLFGTQPILNKFFAEATPQEIRGLFYGLMFFIKVGLASLALVALAFFAEGAINNGFYLLIAFTVGAVIIVLFMKDSSYYGKKIGR